MKILVVSKYGDGAGLAYKMVKEGQDVTLYIKEAYAKRIMDGLVPKAYDIEEALKIKPDFILFDMSGMGDLADDLRKDGHKVIGGSKLMDRLELDREFGIKIAQQFGLSVPTTVHFSSVDEAINQVKKDPKAWAIKLDNNQGTSSSYVAKDAKDMLDYLSYSKEEGKVSKGILQEKIDGSEISTECWVSNGTPIWSASNSTVEDKRLISDGIGPRTGCETSFVFYYQDGKSPILDQTVRPLLPLLKYSQWTGAIDVNSIFSPKDKKAYFLELTPRIGYSAIYAFTTMLAMPISEFFYNMAQGRDFKVPYRCTWGSSLKISVSPYPLECEDEKISKQLYGEKEGIRINGKISDDFIPIDCKKGQRVKFEVAGTSGIVGECVGRGSSLIQAWKASQNVFNDLEVPNKMGRVKDGAENCWKRINDLRKMGFNVPNPSGTNLPGGSETRHTPSNVGSSRH